jgi:hypothetical protein
VDTVTLSKKYSGSEANVECPHCKQGFLPTGIFCKTRPDIYMLEPECAVVELKTYSAEYGTAEDLPKEFFWKRVQPKSSFKYIRQAAFQVMGLNSQNIFPKYYYWIVQEKVFPYNVAVVKADIEYGELGQGVMMVKSALNQIKPCIAEGKFYSYPGVTTMDDIFDEQ